MLEQLEAALWQQPESDERLSAYQQQFAEMERGWSGNDSRHNFIVVIPVADRPQHLKACLGSILELCNTFRYGGIRDGQYNKIEVLIADDSKEAHNIDQHRRLAAEYLHLGLTCHYFGQDEQLAQLAQLDNTTLALLTPIIGNTPSESFYHKGASLMRNITYLKLNDMLGSRNDTLIYFIDSDQEFQVKVQTASGECDRYAINYFHHLDRIFSDSDITILTGKVVGDPPVSPAVMAGNFIDDVTAFLRAMAHTTECADCSFHAAASQPSDDAAYHDMAEMFGFKNQPQSFDYICTIEGEHDHAACFAAFAARLNHFFDGAHPTRKSYYQHRPLGDSVVPARTIYTGNYVFRGEALRYFIPFATLKLRMAGPVLGRIIKAELGARFISANLPMLHKRTVEEIGHAEFRTGVNREQHLVDLSGEFERQFFGDVMLFSMEQLTAQGYPKSVPTQQELETLVQSVEAQLLHNYTNRQRQLVEKIASLKAQLEDDRQWWNHSSTLSAASEQFRYFIANMAANFGSDAPGYQQICSAAHRSLRRRQIVSALQSYPEDRSHWQALLDAESHTS